MSHEANKKQAIHNKRVSYLHKNAKDAIMEEFVQGLAFVLAAMDGQDTIAKHV